MRSRVLAAAAAAVVGIGIAIAAPASAAAPTVSVASPTNITSSSATLRCTVDNGGLATTKVWVTYKVSTGVWGADTITTAQQTAASNGTYSFPVSGLAASTQYDQRCKADNSDSTTVVTPTSTFTTLSGGGGGTGTIVLAAAGDNCDDNPTQYNGIGCRGTANQVIAENPDAVVALGDLQYNNFAEANPNVYMQEWGAFKAKTIPVLGNHEKLNAPYSINQWNSYWGAQAHSGTDYQWREDLGKWSVIVVNSNYSTPSTANKNAVQALIDAANADGDNIVMAFHHPRFASPCSGCHGDQARSTVWMQKAYDSGVDLVLTAHDHRYERYAPMDASGPNSAGVREFLIGSGGAHADGGDGVPNAGNQVLKGDFVGVTMFDLNDTSYSWRAYEVTNVNGAATLFDSGTTSVR